MYFKYGTYTHPSNEVDMTSYSGQASYSKRNRVVFTRYTITLTGHIIQSTQATLKAKIQELEAAYSTDFKDAVLYHDDGTESAHVLKTALSINGVRVRRLEYPKGGGAEYAVERTYRIVLEADYLIAAMDPIYSFSETVRMIGDGGPRWELIPRFQGTPVSRILFNQTPQRIIQHGQAVGILAWPIQPTPLLSAIYEHSDRRIVERQSPYKIGVNHKLLYPLKYQYVFSRAIAISAMIPREDWN